MAISNLYDLALDSVTGDLDLTNGCRLIRGSERIIQELKIRFRTFLGEYFLDTRKGLPWIRWRETKTPDSALREMEALFTAEVQETVDIEGLEPPGVTCTMVNRRVHIKFKARTAFGILTFDQEIAP